MDPEMGLQACASYRLLFVNPILNRQLGYPLKLTDIVRDHDQFQMPGLSGDQQIFVSYGRSLVFQMGADVRIVFVDLGFQG